MTRHLLKLIWNRRRTNVLLIIEVLLSFLAVFGVITLGLYYADNYRRPLGFDYQDVWLVESSGMGARPADDFWRMFHTVQDLPQVEAVATRIWGIPFHPPVSTMEYEVDGRPYEFEWSRVSDDFAKVLRLEVLGGRWFSREDDGAGWEPVVVNERLARYAFGNDDPIGKRMPRRATDDRGQPLPEWRVVGVIREYRSRGEFAAPVHALFERQRIDDPERTGVGLLMRVRSGTTADYHKQVVDRLFQAAPSVTFRVKTLEQWRQENHRERLTPLVVLGTVIGFLLVMVVLGLVGVLWQNVTQRTQEIGLRRAKGATARDIHRQILTEVAIMSTLAVAAGTVLIVQLPLLETFRFVPAHVVAGSLVLSAAVIYVVTGLCGLYPARLATAVQPAEALHYE
jgi:putative ABC transport system permease protein